MRQYALYTFALMAFLLAGCASMVTPKTPDQTVYATYGLYNTVSTSTADLLNAGAITVEEAQAVQSTLMDVRPMLETARGLAQDGAGMPETTLDIVIAIQQRLLELQLYLQQQAQQ